ncbi:hypothetical protein EK904_009824 [Melospiza melodia maxima]|nr:hypothetical protein EK904_009824 [Melospiza melodia maxima]
MGSFFKKKRGSSGFFLQDAQGASFLLCEPTAWLFCALCSHTQESFTVAFPILCTVTLLSSEPHARCVLKVTEHDAVCKNTRLFWNVWRNISTTFQIQPRDENPDPLGFCTKHATSAEHHAVVSSLSSLPPLSN